MCGGGRGLFATRAFHRGEPFCEYLGRRWSEAARRQRPLAGGGHAFASARYRVYFLRFAKSTDAEYWVVPLDGGGGGDGDVGGGGSGGGCGGGGGGDGSALRRGRLMRRADIVATWGELPTVDAQTVAFIDGSEPPRPHEEGGDGATMGGGSRRQVAEAVAASEAAAAAEAADARPGRYANDLAAWHEPYHAAAARLNNAEIVTILGCRGGGAEGGSGGGSGADGGDGDGGGARLCYLGAALVASRDVEAGEEVCLSYGGGYWEGELDSRVQPLLPFIDVSRDTDPLGCTASPPPPPASRSVARLAHAMLCAPTPPPLVDFGAVLPPRRAAREERLRRALEPACRLGLVRSST